MTASPTAQALAAAGADVNCTDRSTGHPPPATRRCRPPACPATALDRRRRGSRRSGTTPLMAAAAAGFVLTLQSLLAVGADAAAADRYGSTALVLAAQAGHQQAVLVLIEHGGSDPEASSLLEPEFRAFHVACRAGWPDVVGALLAAGVDTTAVDADGRTG